MEDFKEYIKETIGTKKLNEYQKNKLNWLYDSDYSYNSKLNFWKLFNKNIVFVELEKNISKQDKTIEEQSSYIGELEETIAFILHDTTWFDRIFNWKTIIDIAESNEDTK